MPQLCSEACEMSLFHLESRSESSHDLQGRTPWGRPLSFRSPASLSPPGSHSSGPKQARCSLASGPFLLAGPLAWNAFPWISTWLTPSLSSAFLLRKLKTSQQSLLWPPYLKLYPWLSWSTLFCPVIPSLYYLRTFWVISFIYFLLRAEVLSVVFTDKPQMSRTVLGTWQPPARDLSTI